MIKLALPTGSLRRPAAEFLEAAGLNIPGYVSGSRSYRLRSDGDESMQIRVFREQDIPVQIALGNYDLGICNLAWVEELAQRYPSDSVVPVCKLSFGQTCLFATVAGEKGRRWTTDDRLRIVSEYPNLAEAFAISARLNYHRILPVKGSAEVYPPEDADIVVVAAADEGEVAQMGLRPIATLLKASAYLIANHASLEKEGVRGLLARLNASDSWGREQLRLPHRNELRFETRMSSDKRPKLRIALPDGHQQPHAIAVLKGAGLAFDGYMEAPPSQRPASGSADIEIKVIRPQDMPQQVALGNFDLAMTGRDWLWDHLRCFPNSPVEEIADLGYGRYTIAAVVSDDLAAETLEDALRLWRSDGKRIIRIASEYMNLADDYARSNHFGHYKVIPITGASEGFVPEDADILIEGTETGKTIIENSLKIIDVIFSSTTCLIARKGREKDGLFDRIATQMASGALAATAAGN